MTSLRNFVRSTWIGRLLLMPVRLKAALDCTLAPVGRSILWTFKSREHHNFTYELSPLNVKYLTAFVSVLTRQDYGTIEKYIEEILGDEDLKSHIIRLSLSS